MNATPTPTASPTPVIHHAIGDVVTIAHTWQIRVTGFKVIGPGDTPAVQVVGVDMSLKNLAAQPASLNDNYLLTFRDSNGQLHGIGEQTDICRLGSGATLCLDALTLNPGDEQSGDLGAVVPVGRRQFTLTLDAKSEAGSGGEVVWDLAL
jgi:hypothetical protein